MTFLSSGCGSERCTSSNVRAVSTIVCACAFSKRAWLYAFRAVRALDAVTERAAIAESQLWRSCLQTTQRGSFIYSLSPVRLEEKPRTLVQVRRLLKSGYYKLTLLRDE